MTTYHRDFTTLPATCSPHCNPGMHALGECKTPPPECGAEHDDYICTLVTGHDGAHEAYGFPDEPPLSTWRPTSLPDHKPPRDPDWPGVGTLRPRSDEDGEVDDELSDWRAAEVYGGGRP